MIPDLQDPDTPPVGRQPATHIVRPSKSTSPWYGSITGGTAVDGSIVGGERFTRQQVEAVMRLGMDPLTAPSMLVKRQSNDEEIWCPTNRLPPVYAFECPVIGKTVDRIRVLAPNGKPKLVLPDGWAHHPFRRISSFRRKYAVECA